jgi:hypothetical protein
LLIGNNDGDGTINAYTLGGVWQGQIQLNTGLPFSEDNLWGITFGTGSASGGSPNVLYFAAGLDGGADGLLGAISLLTVPEPSSAVLGLIALSVVAGRLTWKKSRRARWTTDRSHDSECRVS